jgi:D-3-phosphoglycerate dehydrogenase
MSQPKPRLLLLDDWEGRIRRAPGFARVSALADATVLDQPLSEVPAEQLRNVRFVMAIRERTRFDAAAFDLLPNLELILQTGGHGYHIDPYEAAARGIKVALWRSHDAVEAAMRELTFGLAIAALRKFPEADRSAGTGGWPGLIGGTLRGRRLGVLGMGLQGKAVARLGRAFDMDVVAWARTENKPADDDGVPRLALDDLLRTSDILSIHLRLSDESRGLLNAARLRSMKPGSVLINTARGAIVDEAALAQVLRDGPLAAAGLDVFVNEPLPAYSPLRSLPNVVLSPHIGWTVEEAFREFADGAAAQLEDYLSGNLATSELAFQEVLTGAVLDDDSA